MSDPNSPTPDPSDAVPGYTPPTTPEPAAPSAEPPAYTPPAAPGGYEPPAATPPAYTPPSTPGGYEPPAATPPAYTPPSAGGYSQPPAAGGGLPEPTGFPPPAGYGQQPTYGTDPAAYSGGGVPNLPLAPVGGAPLADWPKRALGGLIDYVAAGIVISIVGSLLSNVSSGLGSLINVVLSVGWMVYLGYKSGTTGVTFGRSIAKTKLISEATGQPIGVGNGIIRQLAHIVDSIICYIGWLFPLWDAKKQTIADKLMKTVVVDNSADPNASTYSWQ
jgi:uncharacterized RDD family membrane protein YckC